MPKPINIQNYVNSVPPPVLTCAYRQRGATLVELMVGIAIGLLTVAVALSTLMVSRGISGTVSESSQMQQDAAYAFRVIGQQVRQAGSIRLNLAFSKDSSAIIDAADPVAFETDFDSKANTISGKEVPGTNEYQLLIGYQNYVEPVFAETTSKSLFRDCLGQQPSATIIQSGFILVKASGAETGELKCAGTDNNAQPIISKVADFKIRYLVQDSSTATPTIKYATTAEVGTNWPAVFGIEVCLELAGNETITTAGATYRNCSWKVGDAEKDRGNKMRMVFKNTFQIRSQNSI